MKGLFKNVALGFGAYIGWQVAKGIDETLGSLYNDKIIEKTREIINKIEGIEKPEQEPVSEDTVDKASQVFEGVLDSFSKNEQDETENVTK